jgi:hypothetical protein
MKKLLLAGVAMLLLASSAHAAEKCVNPDGTQDPVCAERNDEDWSSESRQRVTVVHTHRIVAAVADRVHAATGAVAAGWSVSRGMG